jgi:signal transduction histidine kinase
VFPIFKQAVELLQTSSKSSRQQAELLRKIVDRIRNSLELQVVLQTAVDEVAALFELDACVFLWYAKQTQQVRVVCEQRIDTHSPSHLGIHSLESFNSVAMALIKGQLSMETGTVSPNRKWLDGITLNPTLWQDFFSWRNRQQNLSADVHQNRNQNPQFLLGYEASLLIPVRGKEGETGFIVCLSQQPRHWLADEIEFLQSISESLEIAIRQAQLYHETQTQAIRERLVNHIISQTRQSFDIETILMEAITQLLEAMQCDRCFVHLVDNPTDLQGTRCLANGCSAILKSDTLRHKHLYEVYRPPFASSLDDFDPTGPITQWVIKHQQLVMIPDITQDERIGSCNREYQTAQIKSSLVIPVKANGTLRGILYLNQCSHSRSWSKNDQQLAQSVADQLAISLHQASLYAYTEQQARQSALQAQKMAEMLEQLQRTQTELIQNEKMSSLGRMVAGVAHEINNPVNFIYGNIPYIETYLHDLIRLVQAYQTHTPEPTAEVQKLAEEIDIDFLLRDLPKILKSIEAGAERIHEIVDLLQKFSRNNQASLKTIDFNAALENTLLILHNQIGNSIEVERSYDQLPPVECYPKPIHQAFLYILTNAIEALNRSSNSPKTLTVQTQYVASETIGDMGRVRLMIRDNGIGISPEIQPRIFEPFFTTKEVGQGRGLGLTISYQTLVNQHHGRLEVQSNPGQGTEFLMEIPIRQPKSLKSHRPEKPALERKDERSLFYIQSGSPSL